LYAVVEWSQPVTQARLWRLQTLPVSCAPWLDACGWHDRRCASRPWGCCRSTPSARARGRCCAGRCRWRPRTRGRRSPPPPAASPPRPPAPATTTGSRAGRRAGPRARCRDRCPGLRTLDYRAAGAHLSRVASRGACRRAGSAATAGGRRWATEPTAGWRTATRRPRGRRCRVRRPAARRSEAPRRRRCGGRAAGRRHHLRHSLPRREELLACELMWCRVVVS